MSTSRYTIADLLRVMQRLRDPQGGCPWDLQQNFRSLVPSTLEECYELASAIEHGDYPHIAEELGDVLFQVVFYAQLGEEQELFSFTQIVHTLVDKLLRRHPHVFAGSDIETHPGAQLNVAEVKHSWEAVKRGERAARAQRGVLDDVPLALPALPRAEKLQKRAALVGFDWPDPQAVLAKLDEERGELQEAMAAGDAAAIADEMGDLLFTCVNLARQLGLDAETTLRHASAKFERRFRVMEAAVAESGRGSLAALASEELEALWVAAKTQR